MMALIKADDAATLARPIPIASAGDDAQRMMGHRVTQLERALEDRASCSPAARP